jgi:hypothetical protein
MSAMSTLKGLLDILREENSRSYLMRIQALEDYSRALLETELYLQRLGSGHEKDRDAEAKIADLWRVSALTVGVLEKEMVGRDCEKMYHWINGAKQEVEQLEKKGISLSQMKVKLQELLDIHLKKSKLIT